MLFGCGFGWKVYLLLAAAAAAASPSTARSWLPPLWLSIANQWFWLELAGRKEEFEARPTAHLPSTPGGSDNLSHTQREPRFRGQLLVCRLCRFNMRKLGRGHSLEDAGEFSLPDSGSRSRSCVILNYCSVSSGIIIISGLLCSTTIDLQESPNASNCAPQMNKFKLTQTSSREDPLKFRLTVLCGRNEAAGASRWACSLQAEL